MRDCQAELDSLCSRLWPPQAHDQHEAQPVYQPLRLDDDELLGKAMTAANGAKLRRLWGGVISAYSSASEADMALCSLLAWWANGDAKQIDRLFRQSGLMRPKWDENHHADGSTYGQVAIEKAIAMCAGKGYSGSGEQQQSPHDDRAKDAARAESGSSRGKTSPEPDERPGEDADDGVCRPLFNEAAHAAVLASAWRGSYRWASHEKSWRHWTGRVWEAQAEPVVAAAAQKVLRRHYGLLLAKAEHEAEIKRLGTLYGQACRYNSVLGGLSFLKGEVGFFTAPEEWDSDPYMLNCADGLLTCSPRSLRPHDLAALCTRITKWSLGKRR